MWRALLAASLTTSAAQQLVGVFHSHIPAAMRHEFASEHGLSRPSARTFVAQGVDHVEFGERHRLLVAHLEVVQTVQAHSACSRHAPNWALDSLDGVMDGRFSPPLCPPGGHVFVIDSGIYHDDEFGDRLSNAVSKCTLQNCTGGWNDVYGHGTFCASLAAGAVSGVAAGATLHAVKALNDTGKGTTLSAALAMEWVLETVQSLNLRPAVASMSFGGPRSQVLNYYVSELVAAGVAVVVAAGNDGVDACTQSPASSPHALTVGALDADYRRANFSNWGACVDVYAPGVNVEGSALFNKVEFLSGTSMATPLVAGAVVQIWAHSPHLTVAEVYRETTRGVHSHVPPSAPSAMVPLLATLAVIGVLAVCVIAVTLQPAQPSRAAQTSPRTQTRESPATRPARPARPAAPAQAGLPRL